MIDDGHQATAGCRTSIAGSLMAARCMAVDVASRPREAGA
jgi:hypothetical protein